MRRTSFNTAGCRFALGLDAAAVTDWLESKFVELPPSDVTLPLKDSDETSYQRTFIYQIDIAHEAQVDGADVALVFDGAMADREARMNDSGAVRHRNGDTPSEVRSTGQTSGSERATVRVADPREPAIRRAHRLSELCRHLPRRLVAGDTTTRLRDVKIETPGQCEPTQRVANGRAITRAPYVPDRRTVIQPRCGTANADACRAVDAPFELGPTMICVTHDQTEAVTMADRGVVLRAGVLEQVGTPVEFYINPTTQFVASFRGAPRGYFLRATVSKVDGNRIIVSCEGLNRIDMPELIGGHAVTSGPDVMLAICPEHLSLSSDTGPTIDATVRLTEQLGCEAVLYADASPLSTVGSDTGTDNITFHIGGASAPQAGSKISISFDQQHIYLFRRYDQTLTLAEPIAA